MAKAAANEFFDQGSIYDTVLDHNYMFHDDMYRDVERVLAAHYGERPLSVLDLGCGTARHLAGALSGRSVSRYVGYDLSRAALSRAEENLAALRCPVELHEADLLQGLNGENGRFDLIFSGFSLHHLTPPETRAFFSAAYRRLAAGGVVVLIDTMREEEEDRQTYLDRYCRWIRSEWKALSPTAADAICEHIRENDFPQTESELEAMASEAGFRRRDIDRFRWHHAWAFDKDGSAGGRICEASVDDAAAIARVHVDSWRTTYAGVIPANVLARLSYEARARSWRKLLGDPARRECVYVALDANGTIIGFASGGPERGGNDIYRGELYAIYLVESAQRRGIGRRLIAAIAKRLHESGYESMLVWVLANNACRGFYAALGGEIVSEKPIEIGSKTLTEVAYGWREVRSLLPTKD